MKKDIDIKEASSIVFPTFLNYTKRRTSDLLEPKLARKVKA